MTMLSLPGLNIPEKEQSEKKSVKAESSAQNPMSQKTPWKGNTQFDLFHDVHLRRKNTIAAITTSEEDVAAKNNNLKQCHGCSEPVVMLARKGFKFAYSETNIKIRGVKHVLYYCEECSETREIPDDNDEFFDMPIAFKITDGVHALPIRPRIELIRSQSHSTKIMNISSTSKNVCVECHARESVNRTFQGRAVTRCQHCLDRAAERRRKNALKATPVAISA